MGPVRFAVPDNYRKDRFKHPQIPKAIMLALDRSEGVLDSFSDGQTDIFEEIRLREHAEEHRQGAWCLDALCPWLMGRHQPPDRFPEKVPWPPPPLVPHEAANLHPP